MHWSGSSTDSVATIVAWYRAQLHTTPKISKNTYDGTQADFGMHGSTQVVIFNSPHMPDSGTTIDLMKHCTPTSS